MQEEHQQSPDTKQTSNSSDWAMRTVEKIALAGLQEQKSARRWAVFFKSLSFIFVFFLLLMVFGVIGQNKNASTAHTALIDIAGVIEAGGQVNADAVISSLNDAYDNKGTKGIILRINSPGGSPVQAGIINDEIHRQRNQADDQQGDIGEVRDAQADRILDRGGGEDQAVEDGQDMSGARHSAFALARLRSASSKRLGLAEMACDSKRRAPSRSPTSKAA